LFPMLVIISMVFTYLSKRIALKFDLFIDRPNLRSSHSVAIPRCGGISIVLIFLCSMLLAFGLLDKKIIGFLLGGLVISIVGILDDLINLKSWHKILGMLLASVIPIILGIKINHLDIVFSNQIALYLLTFVWNYGMINSFNFMDGVDGLIGGSTVVFSFFMMLIAFLIGNFLGVFAALVLMAVTLGFLCFNYSPASIFLGDAGSMFIGYNFAQLSILISNQNINQVPIYALALVFAPIIFDSFVTFVRRGLEGKNMIEAHREHLYQRLIVLGLSHRNISIIYLMLNILFGVFAVFFIHSIFLGRVIIMMLAISTLIGFGFFVATMKPINR